MRALKYTKPTTDWLDRQPDWVPWLIVVLVVVAPVRGCLGI